MKIKIAMLSAVVVGMFFAGISNASILNGSVSFNPDTGLFTYSYVISNLSGPAAITELSVLINNQVLDYNLNPIAHADPSGSDFRVATSGGSAYPPVSESGTFWYWGELSVPVGTEESGFSFTTAAPPVQSDANNYFLFADTFTRGPEISSGIVEFGHIGAPQVASVPEPGTLGLLALAGGLLVRRRWQARG